MFSSKDKPGGTNYTRRRRGAIDSGSNPDYGSFKLLEEDDVASSPSKPIAITLRERLATAGFVFLAELCSIGSFGMAGIWWILTSAVEGAGVGVGVSTLVSTIVLPIIGAGTIGLAGFLAYKYANYLLNQAETLNAQIAHQLETINKLEISVTAKLKKLGKNTADIYKQFAGPSTSESPNGWKKISVYIVTYAGFLGSAWGTAAVLMGAFSFLAVATSGIGIGLLVGSALCAYLACKLFQYYSGINEQRANNLNYLVAQTNFLVSENLSSDEDLARRETPQSTAAALQQLDIDPELQLENKEEHDQGYDKKEEEKFDTQSEPDPDADPNAVPLDNLDPEPTSRSRNDVK